MARPRLAILLAVMALTFCYFTLIRWDGLEGKQTATLHWRWEPSAEELFLAELAKSSGNALL